MPLCHWPSGNAFKWFDKFKLIRICKTQIIINAQR